MRWYCYCNVINGTKDNKMLNPKNSCKRLKCGGMSKHGKLVKVPAAFRVDTHNSNTASHPTDSTHQTTKTTHNTTKPAPEGKLS
jgi:hypothetical protein